MLFNVYTEDHSRIGQYLSMFFMIFMNTQDWPTDFILHQKYAPSENEKVFKFAHCKI